MSVSSVSATLKNENSILIDTLERPWFQSYSVGVKGDKTLKYKTIRNKPCVFGSIYFIMSVYNN